MSERSCQRHQQTKFQLNFKLNVQITTIYSNFIFFFFAACADTFLACMLLLALTAGLTGFKTAQNKNKLKQTTELKDK